MEYNTVKKMNDLEVLYRRQTEQWLKSQDAS